MRKWIMKQMLLKCGHKDRIDQIKKKLLINKLTLVEKELFGLEIHTSECLKSVGVK